MNNIPASEAADVQVDARELLKSLARALPLLIVFVGLVGAGTYFGLSRIAPKFEAQATILIESGESQFTRPEGALQDSATVLDEQAILSQVQLLQSRDLARTVADNLDLDARAEFNTALKGGSLLSDILAAIGLGKDPLKASVEERVLERFAGSLSVYAIEKSRVIAIEFTSEDPELAADAVNAVAEEYIALQRAAKRDTTEDATKWLEAEITGLRTRVQEAEAKVETYRTSNDLFVSAGQTAATLPQQQLSDLNTELARVRAARADAKAKADQIRAGISSGAALNQSDVLNSPLIQRLIEQQVALRAQIAQLSATLLPEHPRMRELNAQLIDLDRQVVREAQKILQGLEAEAKLAEAREAEIQQGLATLKSAAAQANDAGVDLRALEREAAAQRDLLDSYLRRYRDALARQQGDYLPADARIISRAAVPITPSFPRLIPMATAASAAALFLGIAFVLIRELASGRPMRRVQFGPLPIVPDSGLPGGGPGGGGANRWADDQGVRRMMPSDSPQASASSNRVDQSLSAVSAQIIAAGYKRTMVTTAEDSDANGRPLAAVALGRAIAQADKRPVLINFREDGANSVSMGEETDLPGFSDLFAGEASFAQVIFRDRKSRVHFIPSGARPLAAGELADERVGLLLSALDHTYDHVILDVADDAIGALARGCQAAVVVSEFDAGDPRTVRAFERISAASDAKIILLVVDPAAGDEPAPELTDRTAGEAA
jgi:succinoglycan biosynthesis transport protein ExoP